MALIPSTRYPAQTDTAAAYPQGKARNAGSFQDGTGTPLEKDWVNDQFGFQQALLDAAGITPTGSPDAVGASQYLDAVLLLMAKRNLYTQQALKGWTKLSPVTAPTLLGTGGISAVRESYRGGIPLVAVGGANGTLLPRADGMCIITADIGTSSVQSLARDPASGTIFAAGGSSTWGYLSTTQGQSWVVPTTKPVGTAVQVVWGNGTFFARSASGGLYYTSPTGDVWTSRAPGVVTKSIAATRTGATEYLLAASQNALVVSSDSGVTWAAGGVFPDAALHVATTDGYLASTPVGSEVLPFFLANISAGSAYRLYRGAAAGTGWALVSTLPMPAALVGDNAKVRLIGDVDTGALLAILQSNSGGFSRGCFLFLSLDAGVSWASSVNVETTNEQSVAMAAGRIFINNARGIAMSNYEIPLL
jgi:hypothetical protein